MFSHENFVLGLPPKMVLIWFCKRWTPFLQIKQRRAPLLLLEFSRSLSRFSDILPVFHGFCSDFQAFCPDFHQMKTYVGALAPPAPASHTTACAGVWSQNQTQNITKRLSTNLATNQLQQVVCVCKFSSFNRKMRSGCRERWPQL